MEYEVMRISGKSVALKTPHGSIALDENKRADGNRYWPEFLEWNAAQPVPLDLSDQPPDPPAPDSDLEEIKSILAKQDRDVSAVDLKTLVLKYLRRQIARGL